MPENNNKTLIIVALIGLFGTITAALIGNWKNIAPVQSHKETTVLENSRTPTQPVQIKEEDKGIPENTRAMPFSGVYIGINTQGSMRFPTTITFKQHGNKVTGRYTLSGMLGIMNGKVSGNTYHYVWELGGYSGLGVSYIQGNVINGTWGYGSSDTNGGTISAQLQ